MMLISKSYTCIAHISTQKGAQDAYYMYLHRKRGYWSYKLLRCYGAVSSHSREHRGEPLLFSISALGSFVRALDNTWDQLLDVQTKCVYITKTHSSCFSSIQLWKCRGWAVKITEFKLWCFWSAECGFESQAVTLVSLSKTLNHCFVLRMGRKAVGPMCCVTHVKEPSALIEKRRGSPRCSWLWLLHAL